MIYDWASDEALPPVCLTSDAFLSLSSTDLAVLTEAEAAKLEYSRRAWTAMADVEAAAELAGTWEQRWIERIADHVRLFASVYYHGDLATAVTADGAVIHEFRLPS